MSETEQLKFAIGALTLRRACDPGQSPEEMLDRIVGIRRGFVTFDIATFVEYAEVPSGSNNLILARGRYAADNDKRFKWLNRWFKIPPDLLQWINQKPSVISDIDAHFRDHPELNWLQEEPVVKQYRELDAQSVVRIVVNENGGPLCSLSLSRKRGAPRPLSDRDWDTLDKLALRETLELVRAAYRAQTTGFRQQLHALFSRTSKPEQVASVLVKRFCNHFEWDYVSIYRTAYARRQFELVAQNNTTESQLQVSKGNNYVQAFSTGAMGSVLDTGEPVRIEDTEEKDEKGLRPYGYLKLDGLDDARSCLMYPMIKIDGHIEWILDCESHEVGAFQQPDLDALADLVTEGETTFAWWFETRLNKAQIDNVDQGILVVDQENRAVVQTE